ncbi:MAG: type I-F CRISPR-associated protein Csy2 [Campylobacterota bacterium]|nr:type I-F CRISPR-associated protein Csy2 [Campylobacterota bacterium]
MRYSKIKPTLTVAITFKAKAINAMNSYLVYGFPSPITFWGFAHTIALKLNTKLYNEAVLPISHYFKNRMEGTTFHQQKSSERDGGLKSQTIVDLPRADIETTIIFKIEYKEGDEITAESIKNIMLKMRFAGGVIIQDSVKINIDIDEKNTLNKINKNGFIYKKEDIELTQGSEIDDIYDCLKITKGDKSGWKIATLLGYSQIEEPQSRDNTRFGYKHQFAEPLIGVAKFSNFNKFEVNLEKDSWHLETSKELIEIKNK